MILAAIFVGLAALSTPMQYQLVVQDKSFMSRDLSGIVEDPIGAPIADAKVDLIACSSSYRNPKVLQSIRSNGSGGFHFARKPFVKNYCLQVSKDGFDQLRFSVVLGKTDRTLHVKLPIAT